MNELVIVCVVLAAGVDAGPVAKEPPAVAAFAKLADPYLKVRVGDTSQTFVTRQRLAELVEYQKRVSSRLVRMEMDANELFNYMQSTRDVVATGEQLSGSPWERLAWQVGALRLSETAHALGVVYFEQGLAAEQIRNQTAAQVEYFRAGVRRSLAECLATLPRPGR
ncbi:MAG: hypothetical protein K2X87_33535 [Gemmataceae bacterium]|nr:hypothetical protein [Gemmataceae bacterium]